MSDCTARGGDRYLMLFGGSRRFATPRVSASTLSGRRRWGTKKRALELVMTPRACRTVVCGQRLCFKRRSQSIVQHNKKITCQWKSNTEPHHHVPHHVVLSDIVVGDEGSLASRLCSVVSHCWTCVRVVIDLRLFSVTAACFVLHV